MAFAALPLEVTGLLEASLDSELAGAEIDGVWADFGIE
jgi:hypothetical protein